MVDDVAPDGSPAAVYRAMPPHDAVDLVLGQVPPGGSVLDLGCGTGRLANELVVAGVAVTGVDVHAGMLAHVSDAVRTVHADILRLNLHATFDVVVLASHLVNHPTDAPAFLATCRRHVADHGVVLLDDIALARVLHGAYLEPDRWLDEDARWLRAGPTPLP